MDLMNATTMKDVMWELFGEEINNVISSHHHNQQGLMPPGFRFHPTDEELITYYLASKVFNGGFCGVRIVEVDLNRLEPWEIPDVAKMGEKEWYFFSLRDRKYPTGLRTNRATGAGYWKATGKDREVHAGASGALVGMKKTLVFYKGRAPHGEKTKWVLHEYRLEGDFSWRHACKDEWVICRIFNKSGGLNADHQKFNLTQHINQPNYNYSLDHLPQSTLLEDLQTLESPIQSLLITNNNPFLNIHHHDHIINPQPFNNNSKSQQNYQHELDEANYFSNWLDVYLQQNPSGIYELPFGTCQLAPDFGPLVPYGM